MDLRIFTEPQQGADYDTLLKVARATEELGFDAFFRSDHYLAMGGDGLPGPTDAWITLAGLARETSRIKLGTLMTAGTFRLPGVLAIQVAQVDAMSGGRVEFGLGAGWFEAEHTAYGIPFPKEKFGRLSEQLAVITGLWATPVGKTFDFDGTFYQLKDSPALPKPAQGKVPVLIGGMGAKRTPELAARYADEFNVPFASIADTGTQFGRVREAVKARKNRSQSISTTDTHGSPASTASRSAARARSGAMPGRPCRRSRSATSSWSAMPPSAHAPQAMEVAGRPPAWRAWARASRNALPAA